MMYYEDPSSFLKNDFANGPSWLACPVCKPTPAGNGDGSMWSHNDQNHAQGPVIVPGRDNYEALDGRVRGDIVDIPVFGECGHDWHLCLGFHKGQTFVWAEDRGERGGLYSGRVTNTNTEREEHNA